MTTIEPPFRQGRKLRKNFFSEVVCGIGFLLATGMMAGSLVAGEEKPALADSISASLVVESAAEEPSHLHIYLHLVNKSTASITWSANAIAGVEVELFGPDGKPAAVPTGGMIADIISSSSTLCLPIGSRMDLRISHNWGISVVEHSNGRYFLQAGGCLWFVPVDAVNSYTLHVKLFGTVDPTRKAHPGIPIKDHQLLLEVTQKISLQRL